MSLHPISSWPYLRQVPPVRRSQESFPPKKRRPGGKLVDRSTRKRHTLFNGPRILVAATGSFCSTLRIWSSGVDIDVLEGKNNPLFHAVPFAVRGRKLHDPARGNLKSKQSSNHEATFILDNRLACLRGNPQVIFPIDVQWAAHMTKQSMERILCEFFLKKC